MRALIKDSRSFLGNFLTRWQALAADVSVGLVIGLWERATGKTINPRLYFLCITGIFSLVSCFVMWRTQKRFIEVNMGRLRVIRHFDRLIMGAYELAPGGEDVWKNECVKFLEKLFKKDSHEVKVFKQEVRDNKVNIRVSEEKARIALNNGGRLSHPNALLRDDGSIIFQLVTLKWLASEFEDRNPASNVIENISNEGLLNSAVGVAVLFFAIFGLIKTLMSKNSEPDSQVAQSRQPPVWQIRNFKEDVARINGWLASEWPPTRLRQSPIEIHVTDNDNEAWAYANKVKIYLTTEKKVKIVLVPTFWGPNAEPKKGEIFCDHDFPVIKIGTLSAK